jgi:hypothetical protein
MLEGRNQIFAGKGGLMICLTCSRVAGTSMWCRVAGNSSQPPPGSVLLPFPVEHGGIRTGTTLGRVHAKSIPLGDRIIVKRFSFRSTRELFTRIE